MNLRRLVGRNVRRIRIEKGLTQEDLADRAEVSQHYVSVLENGRRNPTIETIGVLAKALGVDHLALLQPDGESAAMDD